MALRASEGWFGAWVKRRSAPDAPIVVNADTEPVGFNERIGWDERTD